MGRPRGRPKKNKDPNLDETPGVGGEHISRYTPSKIRGGQRRDYSYTVSEIIRDSFAPKIVLDYWLMVLKGHTPVIVDDKRTPEGLRVIPDPNPLNPTPTLAQRNEAIKELSNRGWGIPPQSINIDMQIKQQLDAGLPAHLLEKPNYKLLAEMNALIKKYKEEDIVDAELVTDDRTLGAGSGELQEPCQVAEPIVSGNGEVLQELGQSIDLGQALGDVVEDLILNNDAVNEYKELSNPGSTRPGEDSEE